MMKERQIRTILPFVIVFATAFFLSDANLFENFGTRIDMIKQNLKLLWFLIVGDAGQAVVFFVCSRIFFIAWKKNRDKKKWFVDIFWQLSALFFCWVMLCLISLFSSFYTYLWIQGMVKFFVFIFCFYFFNTLWAARKMLYHPETPEEALKKAAKFNELIDLIKKNESEDKK